MALFFTSLLIAQPAHVEELKRQKERYKEQMEHEREIRKAEDEYYKKGPKRK